jgi:DNA-binding FadR family transcriptional regulator
VREAIKYLTATGLVAARKGVGVYVAGMPRLIASPAINLSMQVDPEHIQALFDFRCMQEMLTARIATEQITLVELRELERIVATNYRYAKAGEWEPFHFSPATTISIARLPRLHVTRSLSKLSLA